MEREGTSKGLGSGSAFRQLDERSRVAVGGEGLPRLRKPLFDLPEKRDRRGPRRPVARLALRAQMSAEGQELGEVGDHSDVSLVGNAHETVGVEVVAEEDARVAVCRRKQAGPPVVEKIALVDRLDAEREALVREGREDRKLLPFRLRPKCCAPERTLPLCLPGDGLPDGRGP
jgi:hypothetical protein